MLIAAEGPVLERHGLTMWAYVVLSVLGREPHTSQGALADEIRADRTRIIAVLDDLQERGLITREPDPADRRVRLVAITAAGERSRNAARRDIRRGEQRLLELLPTEERQQFLRTVEFLADSAPDALL
ncbi:MarR family winged helix-turn-helix transcriptional regulator [Nakamurella alba]|uniref:MarR family winged helix-turn-helix transcriptional regulator n=1 Tax=Nakamurella alba TaxID=2665158 RepID=UPI002AC369E5|nr:MarR family transcriptional regulator [Nakamurella alba]